MIGFAWTMAWIVGIFTVLAFYSAVGYRVAESRSDGFLKAAQAEWGGYTGSSMVRSSFNARYYLCLIFWPVFLLVPGTGTNSAHARAVERTPEAREQRIKALERENEALERNYRLQQRKAS